MAVLVQFKNALLSVACIYVIYDSHFLDTRDTCARVRRTDYRLLPSPCKPYSKKDKVPGEYPLKWTLDAVWGSCLRAETSIAEINTWLHDGAQFQLYTRVTTCNKSTSTRTPLRTRRICAGERPHMYSYGFLRAPISRAGWELASGSLRGCRAGLERA